jgi:hypothetical protein
LHRRCGVVPTAQGREGLPERGPLAGTVHLGMRGKDLLAQRGAGARHPDDEHRRRIGVAGARAGREAGAVEQRHISMDEGRMRLARERLEPAQQRMAGLPMAECCVVLVLAGPEFGQIVMRHDPVFRHGFRPHCRQSRRHLLGLLARACAVAFGERQEHKPPAPQRRQLGRDRAEPDKCGEHRPRLRRPAELKEHRGAS